jgi:hypothetical protein
MISNEDREQLVTLRLEKVETTYPQAEEFIVAIKGLIK